MIWPTSPLIEYLVPKILLNLQNRKEVMKINYQPLLEHFLLVNTSASVVYSFNSNWVSSTFYIEPHYWAKSALLVRLNLPNKSTYMVDGIQFSLNTTSVNFQYNFSSFAVDSRISFFTTIPLQKLELVSICSIFPSSSWLERELSDFTNIYFLGLLDTRRLLLDYFQDKKLWETHIKSYKSYSNTFYEVVFNY